MMKILERFLDKIDRILNKKIISEKGEKVAAQLMPLFAEQSEGIISIAEAAKSEKVFTEQDEGELFRELTFFFIYIIDKIAIQYLGEQKRNVFMDALRKKVFKILSKNFLSKILDVDNFLISMCNERLQEYSKYKGLVLEDAQETGKTLYWEFSQKIGILCGLEKHGVFIPIVEKRLLTTVVGLKNMLKKYLV